jgi:hypothetical protein
VRLYGRVDLLVNNQRCLVPAGRALELLVLLAAWPGTVVIESTVTGRLAATPSIAVNNEVSHLLSSLRRSVNEVDPTMTDGWIERVHGGFAVAPEFVSSDISEGKTLLEGDPNDTSVMWWAEPLVGLPEEPFLHIRARLDSLALELARVALTRPEPAIGRVEIDRLLELLSRHPDEQELWALLVDAAVATGDESATRDVRTELDFVYRSLGEPIPAEILERLGG